MLRGSGLMGGGHGVNIGCYKAAWVVLMCGQRWAIIGEKALPGYSMVKCISNENVFLFILWFITYWQKHFLTRAAKQPEIMCRRWQQLFKKKDHFKFPVAGGRWICSRCPHANRSDHGSHVLGEQACFPGHMPYSVQNFCLLCSNNGGHLLWAVVLVSRLGWRQPLQPYQQGRASVTFQCSWNISES